MESLNSFEFHWKGTTPTRCTRADKYSPPERDAATYLTHEARAVKHCKMSMGKPLLELVPAPPPYQLPVPNPTLPNLAALFTGPVLL